MIALGCDWILGNAPDRFGRIDGLLLLAGFTAFLVLTIRNAFKTRAESEPGEAARLKPLAATVLTAFGLAGVLLGSLWTVEGATRVAQALGMSEALIGLTIVAIGTSLPELTTSLFAAFKGHADLAIGNIVGSNIFNLLFVMGVSASIRPVPVPTDRGRVDLLFLAVFSAILLPFALTQKKLGRGEGMLLVLGYATLMIWRTFF